MKSTAFADERGETLVEILVALFIIFLVLTAFLAALSTATFGVATVRERVTAANFARAQLECIQDHPYVDSAAPISYTTACAVTQLPSYPMGLSISYWYSPTATPPFTTTPGLDDLGMQWITVTIYHNSESVFTIEKYKVKRDQE